MHEKILSQGILVWKTMSARALIFEKLLPRLKFQTELQTGQKQYALDLQSWGHNKK